jgi:hypothetical protein
MRTERSILARDVERFNGFNGVNGFNGFKRF